MRTEHAYWTFAFLHAFGMALTFAAYVPFLRSIGLTLGEVGLINVVFWTVTALAELPTGMCADGKSRTWSIKRGLTLQAMGSAAYFFADGFWGAALGEALLGLGLAFLSGAHQAWLVDALRAEGRSEAQRAAFGGAAMAGSAGMLLGGVGGGLFLGWDVRYIWIPYAVLALPIGWLVRRCMDGRGDAPVKIKEIQALRKSVILLSGNRSLLFALVAFMLYGFVLPVNHYWSPYFIAQFGEERIGWVWALIHLSLIPGGWIVRFTRPSGAREPAALVGSLFAAGIGTACIAFVPGPALPLVALAVHEASRGTFQPLMEAYVQERVESDHRATYGSLQSFIGKLGFAVVPLAVWASIINLPNTPETIELVWAVTGTLMATLAAGMYALGRAGGV